MPPIDSVSLQGPATVVDGGTISQMLEAPGAEINHRDAWGQTAAFIAARSGNASALRALCEREADISIPDHVNGATPLHMVVGGDYIEATAVLLNAGGDLAAKDHNGLTPVDYANRNNSLKALAEIEAFQRDGSTTLEVPADHADPDGDPEFGM